jgi:hypothetical protein
MSRTTVFDNDRAEISSARQDIDGIRARTRSLEDQLQSALSRQLSELSIAIAGIRDIGALLEQLRVLRGK